jgi:CubicO group peptidase (beta-lactamase class C family)
MDAIATAAELGLMSGAPPFAPERLVTLANWQDPPFNRWAFQHVAELIPTVSISRWGGDVWELPHDERDLSAIRVHADGLAKPLDAFLERTYTDGLVILHGGRIVDERYFNGMAPDSRHLLMSVSKSITSAVCGVLVARGLLAPDAAVTT